jgi:hypothetical protein
MGGEKPLAMRARGGEDRCGGCGFGIVALWFRRQTPQQVV